MSNSVSDYFLTKKRTNKKVIWPLSQRGEGGGKAFISQALREELFCGFPKGIWEVNPYEKVATSTPTFAPTFAFHLKSRSKYLHLFFKFPSLLSPKNHCICKTRRNLLNECVYKKWYYMNFKHKNSMICFLPVEYFDFRFLVVFLNYL